MKKIVNNLFITSLVFYIMFLFGIILFKYVSPLEIFSEGRILARSTNFIPFNDLLKGEYNSLDIFGNIILFIPAGIYFPLLSKKENILKIISKTALISLTFEICQYIFMLGASDITDIITNTFGGFIGITVYILVKKVLKSKEKIKTFIAICSTVVMIPVAFILIMTFLSN